MTPLFVIFLLKKYNGLALMVFVVAGVSDGLDGFIARYFNQRTVLGAYLDPIADKLLLMAAYISLAVLSLLPASLAVVVISRDVVIVLGIVVLSILNIRIEIKPTIVSKFTTFSQLTTIFWALLDPQLIRLQFIGQVLYWSTAALTTLSGLHYMYIGLNIMQNALGNGSAKK